MNRTKLISTLIFVSSLKLYAIPFADAFLPHLQPPAKQDSVMRCPNFSGKWKGKCEGFSGINELTRVIHQHDCEGILSDGQYTRFGSMKSESQTEPMGQVNTTWSSTSTLEWDEAGTALVGQFSGAYKVMGAKGVNHYSGRTKLYFQGAYLITEFSMTGINARCQFERQ